MSQEASGHPVEIEGARQFEQIIGGGEVVLVDFYADWCAPCRMMEPAVEGIAAESDVTVAKVDIDENPRVAAAYGVQSVPTVIVFRGGEPVQKSVGAKSKDQLLQLVRAA